MKNNAKYFSHDNNMRNDSKILLLRNKYGHKGYAFWCMLIEVICDKNDFKIKLSSDEDWEALSIDLRIDIEELLILINYLEKLGLIKKTFKTYEIPNLLKRMQPLIDKRAKLKSFADNRVRSSSGQFTQTSGNNNQNIWSKTPQNKIKENIINNIYISLDKQIEPFKNKYSTNMLTDFLLYWKDTDKKGKEKWQLQKTWNIDLRLQRWKRQQDQWDYEKSQKNILKKVSDEELSHKRILKDVEINNGFTKAF